MSSDTVDRKCCPECKTTHVYKRKGIDFGGPRSMVGDETANYRCKECHATFDKPDYKTIKPHSSTAKYAGLEPADVGLD